MAVPESTLKNHQIARDFTALELVVLVERLEDGGAAKGVAGQENGVEVDPPSEGGEVKLILREHSSPYQSS